MTFRGDFMKTKQIVFTEIGKAELLDAVCAEPASNEVRVKMAYTAISCGTERANLMGDVNVDASCPPESNIPQFPRYLGYSGSGVVDAVGESVKDLKAGDRVVVTGSYHKGYCNVNEKSAFKIESEKVSLDQAAFSYIAAFSLAAVRKTRLEMGESMIVMGLGILGIFAVHFSRAAGAYPVIAVDPEPARREFALKMGADFALDPFDPDFQKTVKKITGKGAKCAIEVSGSGKALDQVLDCMARFGRVALLGCTRDSDFTIDYYRKVHYPGITLVGAHTGARPTVSSPGWWALKDDVHAMLSLIEGGRLDFSKIICQIRKPEEAPDVYTDLANNKNFPIGTLFDWEGI
jgi:2-desacetyl-2-hydroxyethyl bacteriochlorophyllide A dehydrogenase